MALREYLYPAKSQKRDDEITRLEQRLEILYRARRGEKKNAYGWYWCEGCGRKSVSHLNEGRATVGLPPVDGGDSKLCSDCWNARESDRRMAEICAEAHAAGRHEHPAAMAEICAACAAEVAR